MSDLPGRLRNEAPFSPDPDLLKAAADELERLYRKLGEIEAYLGNHAADVGRLEAELKKRQ